MTRSSLLSGLACLTLISHADEAAPLQLVGTTQIDRSFTAYLREDGNEHVFTLGEGETALTSIEDMATLSPRGCLLVN